MTDEQPPQLEIEGTAAAPPADVVDLAERRRQRELAKADKAAGVWKHGLSVQNGFVVWHADLPGDYMLTWRMHPDDARYLARILTEHAARAEKQREMMLRGVPPVAPPLHDWPRPRSFSYRYRRCIGRWEVWLEEWRSWGTNLSLHEGVRPKTLARARALAHRYAKKHGLPYLEKERPRKPRAAPAPAAGTSGETTTEKGPPHGPDQDL